jgi:hypothetical protein
MADYNVTVSLGGVGATATSGVYNVLDYGAAGNGTTDDTSAIQATIDACEAAGGGTVVIPPLEYLITAGLTVEQDSSQRNLNVVAYGAYIKAASGFADTLLTVGSDSSRSYGVNIRGGRWGLTDRDWSSTVGIELLNAVNCSVEDTLVWNAEKGLSLRGTNSKGCVYNVIKNPVEWNCKYGVHLSCDANSGWVNANNFFGGLASWTSSLDGTDISSSYGIAIIPDASYDNEPNSNVFVGMSIEASSAQTAGYEPYAAYITGYQNTFDNVRTENLNDPEYALASTGTAYNRIIANHADGSYVSDQIADADMNKVSVWTNRQVSINGGSADESVMSLYARSSGYRGLDIYESLGATPTLSLYGGGYMTMAPRAEPSSPEEGMVYYDSTANKLKVYTGSAWETITSST